MVVGLGMGAWVGTASHSPSSPASGGTTGGSKMPGGSLYGYVVGLIAAAIGWGVLGSIEGVLGGILDAAVLCWVSESRLEHGGDDRVDRGGFVGGGERLDDDGEIGRRRGRREGRYCLEANRLFGD